METMTIYEIAANNKISVNFLPLPKSQAMSVCAADGSCHIAIDPNQLTNEADEKVKLCHELGHCITGSFYSIDNVLDLRGRHEYRANKWAIKQLVPIDDLLSALQRGITSLWELADYFGVTEWFMQKAYDYYHSQYPNAIK